MIGVLYPARTVRGFPRAPQLTPAEAGVFAELAPHVRPGLPAAGVDWGATLTHGHVGAPPLPGRRPVLLYSPGGGDSRTLGTTLAEDLASHGRVVVLVDHPGDASQVELPGGIRVTVLRGEPDPATFRTMVDTRVADLRLVLDRLGSLPSPPSSTRTGSGSTGTRRAAPPPCLRWPATTGSPPGPTWRGTSTWTPWTASTGPCCTSVRTASRAPPASPPPGRASRAAASG